MKKPQLSLLVLVTCICAAFTLGFFTGRNQNRTEVLVHTGQTVSAVPETTQSTTPAPEAQASAPPESTAGEEPASTAEADPMDTSGRININTATHAELMSLPGIGEVIAQRIIDYRTANGSFRAVEDLLNVSGIGEKKLEAILDLVTAGG